MRGDDLDYARGVVHALAARGVRFELVRGRVRVSPAAAVPSPVRRVLRAFAPEVAHVVRGLGRES